MSKPVFIKPLTQIKDFCSVPVLASKSLGMSWGSRQGRVTRTQSQQGSPRQMGDSGQQAVTATKRSGSGLCSETRPRDTSSGGGHMKKIEVPKKVTCDLREEEGQGDGGKAMCSQN